MIVVWVGVASVVLSDIEVVVRLISMMVRTSVFGSVVWIVCTPLLYGKLILSAPIYN